MCAPHTYDNICVRKHALVSRYSRNKYLLMRNTWTKILNLLLHIKPEEKPNERSLFTHHNNIRNRYTIAKQTEENADSDNTHAILIALLTHPLQDHSYAC